MTPGVPSGTLYRVRRTAPPRRLPALRMDKAALYAAERDCLWHPFTQMREWVEGEPIIVERAHGATLVDIEGREYLDGTGALWCNLHGHHVAEIDQAIRAQLDKVAHSTLLGLGSEAAARFAAELVAAAPAGLSRCFYSDSGSTAVEVALKIAYQFWQQEGTGEHRGRTRFLCLTNAYHGDTLGSVSVGGIELFHKIFAPLLFDAFHAPSPYCYRCPMGCEPEGCAMECFDALARLARDHREEIAAVIVEPLMQGAAGMIAQPPGYLRRVRELCDELDLLLICDEVAVGLGRTGTLWACDQEGVAPDLLCLAKGISGGTLPLAATLTTERIFEAFLGDYAELKTFFHGHTYTGNALACAAASASLELLLREGGSLAGVTARADHLARNLEAIAALPHVGEVRQRGLMVGIELVADRATRASYPWEERRGWQVCQEAIARGVYLRPLGDVVVLMPPLTITFAELDRLVETLAEAIGAALG